MSADHKAAKDEIQRNRNEAYQVGWDDGYAEGFGKSTDLSQASVAAALEAAAMKNDNFAAHLQAEAFMFLLRDVSEAARLASEVAKLFKVEANAIRALITPAQHDALQASIDAEVAKAWAEDAAKIEAMPRREELMGGQRTQYVQLHEVLAWIGAKP